MNYPTVKRTALKIFIGFLGLTALIAIVSVLAGNFGDTQWKILATTFTISMASICSMSGIVFIEKKRQVMLGCIGIVSAIVSALLVIVMLWGHMGNDDILFKCLLTLIVLAIAFALGFLLMLPELDAGQRWFQTLTSVCICLLALQIIVAIWWEIQADVYYRILAVMAIIIGLQTLLLPMLMKLRKGDVPLTEQLLLVKVEHDLYRDLNGKTYRLIAVENAHTDHRDEVMPTDHDGS